MLTSLYFIAPLFRTHTHHSVPLELKGVPVIEIKHKDPTCAVSFKQRCALTLTQTLSLTNPNSNLYPYPYPYLYPYPYPHPYLYPYP